jgi:hypothetical protein
MSQDTQLELVDDDGGPDLPSAANQAIATLPPVERAALVLKSSETEQKLLELVKRSADIQEVKNHDGREQAHRMAMDLRKARTTITNNGKAARDDANAFCTAVLAEEKRLIALTKAEEERVFALRDGWDAKLKAEKEAREKAEAERKATIQSKIDAIADLPIQSVQDSAADMAATIADLEAFEASEEEFAEFRQVAAQAAITALSNLRAMHAAAVAREQAAAELAAQKAELERQQAELRAQQEELDRKRREQEEAEAQRMAAEDARVADSRAIITNVEQARHGEPEASKPALIGDVRLENPDMEQHYRELTHGDIEAMRADDSDTQPIFVEPTAMKADLPTVTLRFEGYSDDTFGEVEHFGDDFDNAASGKPIRYLVTHPDVEGGLVVVGQYGRDDVPGDWFIGVAGYDPECRDVPMPDWPVRIARSERPYSPALIIEAPAGVRIQCMEREEG